MGCRLGKSSLSLFSHFSAFIEKTLNRAFFLWSSKIQNALNFFSDGHQSLERGPKFKQRRNQGKEEAGEAHGRKKVDPGLVL